MFKTLGLTLTQAVQTAKSRGEVREPKFNQETLDAMQEAMDIRDGKIQAKRYASVEEMFADDD